MRLLVTGGAGFIGSNFIRHILAKYPDYEILNLDKLTYAGSLDNLKDIEDNPRYQFIKGDICDKDLVNKLMKDISVVIHFAAESHVTRSEKDPEIFYKTNVEGTKILLEAAKKYKIDKFVHISTDEIYGSISEGYFKEEDKELGDEQATSAYAKSKSQADDLALSYKNKLPVLVVRPTNNFGPNQYPEKALPRWIIRLISKKPIPVWGEGEEVRDWLYVEDTCRAIDLILHQGKFGQAYNVAANNIPEIKNIDIANWLIDYFGLGNNFIKFVPDPRVHHDFRYALDNTKIKKLGWRPGPNPKDLIFKTVKWYQENSWWWQSKIKEAESIYKDI